jgi:uncharacterized protein YdaU (DUF1376 family)
LSAQPYLPLYFGDFLASTAEWSGEEQALYLLLLGHQWSLGSLPNDPEKVRRMARWEKRAFSAAWETVRAKFTERDGRAPCTCGRDRSQALRCCCKAVEQNACTSTRGAEASRQHKQCKCIDFA